MKVDLQIDLVCDKCHAEMKTRQVRKGTLLCRCPNCKYKFRITVSDADEMVLSF